MERRETRGTKREPKRGLFGGKKKPRWRSSTWATSAIGCAASGRKKPGRAACICILNTYPREPPNRPLPPPIFLFFFFFFFLFRLLSTFLSFWESNFSSSRGGERIGFNNNRNESLRANYDGFFRLFLFSLLFWNNENECLNLFRDFGWNDCKRGIFFFKHEFHLFQVQKKRRKSLLKRSMNFMINSIEGKTFLSKSYNSGNPCKS